MSVIRPEVLVLFAFHDQFNTSFFRHAMCLAAEVATERYTSTQDAKSVLSDASAKGAA